MIATLTPSRGWVALQLAAHVLLTWCLALFVCVGAALLFVLGPLRLHLFAHKSWFVAYFQVVLVFLALGFAQLSTAILRRRMARMTIVGPAHALWRLSQGVSFDRMLNLKMLFITGIWMAAIGNFVLPHFHALDSGLAWSFTGSSLLGVLYLGAYRAAGFLRLERKP